MRLSFFVVFSGIMSQMLSANAHGAMSTSPLCAVDCWENSMYVSRCFDDLSCLCTESEYQNTVSQCIYAQCDTSQLGLALHHVILECFAVGIILHLTTITSVKSQDLRKRWEADFEASVFSVDASGGTYPTQSIYSGYATESIGYPMVVPTQTSKLSQSCTTAFTSPTSYSIRPSMASVLDEATTTDVDRVQFTGAAQRFRSRTRLSFHEILLVVSASLYLAL